MLVGLQTEVDKNECDNKDVQSNVMANSTVERTVVSTYGTFLAESLAEWSEQVLDLGNLNQNYIRFQRSAKLCRLIIIVQSGKFDGRVIQRELSMITNLMTEDNFEGVMKDDGKPLNVTRARVWFEVGGSYVMVAVLQYRTPVPRDAAGLPPQQVLRGVQRHLRPHRLRRGRQLPGGGVVLDQGWGDITSLHIMP